MKKNTMNKVNREELIRRTEAALAESYPDRNTWTLDRMMDALEDQVKQALRNGERVCITGFGSLYTSMHKGHPVQFGSAQKTVPDYKVCRFSASNVLNKYVRE